MSNETNKREEYVLTMYDVRGIQDYIFKTPKLKDAIGASYLVENIIPEALENACREYLKKDKNLKAETKWEDENGAIVFNSENLNNDIQTLYIGGGNAYVLFKNRDLSKEIGMRMSKYVLQTTYSLQLAIATIDVTWDYMEDYKNINLEMGRIKANMPESKPIGSIPIMKYEYSTGLPMVDSVKETSRETEFKRTAEEDARREISKYDKIFDNYIEEKYDDSTLAVVHIDGNNMGLRIRNLMEKENDYVQAVNKIRGISYNINHSFKDAFLDMQHTFNNSMDRDKHRNYVLKVITAGDDITYVCRGKAAIASVEYFVKEIINKSMYNNNIEEYGFTVCAGISYIRSHFPFSIGYEVAEACCSSAKSRAKKVADPDKKIGNFVDFQFCKNVQTKDLKQIRKEEYDMPAGEHLMIRPYEISDTGNQLYNFGQFKEYMKYFSSLSDKKNDTKQLPRSHAKTLRNTYPLGEEQVEAFKSFLDSRSWVMPGGDLDMYVNVIEDGKEEKYAKYYDSLEMMDCYIDLSDILSTVVTTTDDEKKNEEAGNE